MSAVLLFPDLIQRPALAESGADFQKEIRPLLENYCTKCHSANRKKGGVDLSRFLGSGAVHSDPKTWETTLAQVRDRNMPPEDKPQPTPEERDRLAVWIESALEAVDESKLPKDPGRYVLHRLSRLEYNNTVRDLFGVNTRPADKFPPDGGGGGGFDNNAATLFIPPVLMERYIAAKKHIFDRQTKKDVAIIGVDDALSDALAKEMRALKRQCVIPIGTTGKLASGVHVTNGLLINSFALREESGDLRGIKSLQGAHNWQNAAAAYAACFAHGLSHAQIMGAMQSYPGLKHRMQWLGEINGVQYVNDSKATNADAAEKALMTYDHIYWIAGGVAKEGGIEPLQAYFPKIKHTYLIGEAAPTFAKTLKGMNVTMSGTLEAAFAQAVKDAPKGSAIVLSPACASFDQYPNFEVRGDAFIALYEKQKG